MKILDAYDLTGSLRDAGELAGCSHHTVKHYVDRRAAGGELDRAAARPGVTAVWLTDWHPDARARMAPFPGPDWPAIDRPQVAGGGRTWWKLPALERWLHEHQEIRTVAWCDDHLRHGARKAAARRRLAQLDVDLLPVVPRTDTGLTPAHLDQLDAWATDS